jgi:hypothetical protein
MRQSKTDYGTRGESGEKLPKRDTASDTSGERHESTKNGVGMGKSDKTGVMYGKGRPAEHMGKHDGRLGEHNTGNMGETVIYEHNRVPHDQDD